MDPFSSYKYTTHETPMWAGRDSTLTSHYRFYSEFQDNFEPQSFENHVENPSLDLYDIPHQQTYFSFLPQEPVYYQSRQWLPMSNRAPTFIGGETEHNDVNISKREEIHTNQANISAETYKYQSSRHPPAQASNNVVKGFMDLVTKSSSFWMNKFGGPTSSAGLKHQEKDQQESQKGLFGKKDVKLTISYPCLISTNSLNNHKAPFELQEDAVSINKLSVREEKDTDELDKMKIGRVTKKSIRKTQRINKDKWSAAHDQKLLGLVQELGTSWNDIAEAFKEGSVTAKYVRERYRVLSKKGARPKRQAFTREEDLEIAKYYKQCEGNWESIAKFFPTRRSAVIRNRFYSTIRGHLDEYLKEVESLKSEGKIIELSTKENTEENFVEEKNLEQTQESQSEKEIDMEVEENPSKSQDELLDSYFNKETITESEDLFNVLEGVAQEGLTEPEGKNSLTLTRKVEEDDEIGGLAWGDKPAKEAIEILNGRISLLTSLYNQTRIELVKLQSEA